MSVDTYDNIRILLLARSVHKRFVAWGSYALKTFDLVPLGLRHWLNTDAPSELVRKKPLFSWQPIRWFGFGVRPPLGSGG